jgi:hypothetical protein
MLGDPKECRERARQCAEMAARARTDKQRERLSNLEQAWLSFAADLERNQTLLDAYPPPLDGHQPSNDQPGHPGNP